MSGGIAGNEDRAHHTSVHLSDDGSLAGPVTADDIRALLEH